MNFISLTLLSQFVVFLLLASEPFRASSRPVLSCSSSGSLPGKPPPPGQCDTGDDSDCCKSGQSYPIYTCSPTVTGHTPATLTLNSFEKEKDGGGQSECDNQYHSDSLPVMALSTGWFNHRSRCHQNITIYGNGNSVSAMVVDECDSTMGCDADHDYQPPCDNNIVDASKAVWEALGVPSGSSNYGWMDITLDGCLNIPT